MESFPHRPVAGAPRVGEISGAAVVRREAEVERQEGNGGER